MRTAFKALIFAAVVSLTSLTACKKEVIEINRGGWTSNETAARDSVEGKFRAEGKHWVKTDDAITVGCYVQDTLEGRQNQPVARGAIGKVVEISPPGQGQPAATVDFGRGYKTGINLSELSRVKLDKE